MKEGSVKFVGVDVAKEHLELYCSGLKLPTRLNNNPKAIAAWLRRLLVSCPAVHVVCESTGGCENELLRACWQAKVPVSQLNPTWVRAFARSKGLLAKTDAIDARVLADYGSVFTPKPTPEPSARQVLLAELVARREDLKTQRAAESNRLSYLENATMRRMIKSHLRWLDKHIAQIEKLMEETISEDPVLRHKRQVLVATQGVGKVVAATLLADLPELGSLSRQAAPALAGVAPFNRDSGTLRGKRSIRGGRATARKALYMAALVGSRSNPVLRDFYQRLRQRGKPGKVALTALMRKLVVHLNSQLKIHSLQPSPC
jgi:transposase